MKKIVAMAVMMVASTGVFAQAQEVFDKFAREVKTVALEPVEVERVKHIAQAEITSKGLMESQFFLLVDSNEKKQNAFLAHYNAQTSLVSISAVATKVSTGSARMGHFITPTGWLESLPANGSYRAQGTLNEYGVRGLGLKGMRVWDFGWQKAQAGWKKKEDIREIRMQMHATDPNGLEARLGRPDSKGCIRVHSSMNAFLDKYGIIDHRNEEAQYWVLRKDRQPVTDAGSLVLVVNSASTDNQANTAVINH